ncbi:hypothetical protein FQZ97_1119330 [compost metagenome]
MEVGDEEQLHPGFGQRAHDLAGDFRSFPFVGGGERLVAQQDGARTQAVDDGADAAQLLVQLAALHPGVLLALVVGEEVVAQIGAQPAGGYEHAALQHQLGNADAAQEGRFAALVGAGDDE